MVIKYRSMEFCNINSKENATDKMNKNINRRTETGQNATDLIRSIVVVFLRLYRIATTTTKITIVNRFGGTLSHA